MKLYSLAICKDAPSIKNCVWFKPVSGGFTIYAPINGGWRPLKVADDKGTTVITDGNAHAEVYVTSIKNMTDKQLDSLNVGDKVIKKTGNQCHLYTVTYKGSGVGEGICMTYQAAGLIETVSYDYTADGWVYNSTDKCTIDLDD